MAIYEPNINLSQTDRSILVLLGNLILQHNCSKFDSNLRDGDVSISCEDANKLLEYIEHFIRTKRFIEGSYFAEGLARGEEFNDPRLREIYLSWHSKRGQSRVQSGNTWREFVARAGFRSSSTARTSRTYGSKDVSPMTIDHFIRMESRLLNSVGLNDRVKAVVMEFLTSRSDELEKARRGQNIQITEHGHLASTLKNFGYYLNEIRIESHGGIVNSKQLSSVLIIIVDFFALCTTRDWNAAGVMSIMAAALPEALGKP